MAPLPPGQAGIRFRSAWLDADLPEMMRLWPLLDEGHRVEFVLGAALRDGRDGFGAARALGVGADPVTVLSRLMGEPDTRLDEAASAWIAARVISNGWAPDGAAASPEHVASMEACARAYGAGVGGAALLAQMVDRPLHAAVARYYTTSPWWVLGPRPLLILAAGPTGT